MGRPVRSLDLLARAAPRGASPISARGRSLLGRAYPDRAASARGVYWASALLALAALADSAIEHYRGSFHNKAMYVPLGVSSLTLAASCRNALNGGTDRQQDGAVDNLALATGVIGTGFHLYNITKRPGGFSWLNLFYAAPLGAPAALSLAGLLRKAGGALSSGATGLHRLGRLLAGLVAAGLAGSSLEAALLHFRGAYHNPAMMVPVTIPPVAAAALAGAAIANQGEHRVARWSLRSLLAVGVIGSAFHVYGVSRNMGGWRNWSQNVLNGPPIPAPPAFTALAIAGLVALSLIEETKS